MQERTVLIILTSLSHYARERKNQFVIMQSVSQSVIATPVGQNLVSNVCHNRQHNQTVLSAALPVITTAEPNDYRRRPLDDAAADFS